MGDMVDMAKPPEELRDNAPAMPEQSIYPYNLCITLEDDELEKLELDINEEECQVGNYVEIKALAEIIGKNIRSTTEGDKKCLNLQITHLQVTSEEDSENEESSEYNYGAA